MVTLGMVACGTTSVLFKVHKANQALLVWLALLEPQAPQVRKEHKAHKPFPGLQVHKGLPAHRGLLAHKVLPDKTVPVFLPRER